MSNKPWTSPEIDRPDVLRPLSSVLPAEELFDKAQAIIALVGRVAAKFPYDELPASLKAFPVNPQQMIGISLTRFNRKGVTTLLQVEIHGAVGRVVLPEHWLSLQQSQIAVEVRKMFWAKAQQRNEQKLTQLKKDIDQHEAQVKKDQNTVAELRKQREDLWDSMEARRRRKHKN